MTTTKTVGSVCSGIEAATVAWKPLGMDFKWFSEIAPFPTKVLSEKYPNIPNLGDMYNISSLIHSHKIEAPDIVCGGTPCQAFSTAGWQHGLNDSRGNLTLEFVNIVESVDLEREKLRKQKCIVFWENVEGVLHDKTNAFGCLVSSLAGTKDVLQMKRWPSAGLIRGNKRNVAWRVLDARYFGLPQQRRRLYLLAGGKEYHPEDILFELHNNAFTSIPDFSLLRNDGDHSFEVFRSYSDCLYSAYATKWNGNAAAKNGSLFAIQDGKIRRLSPVECERLMGFPDDYTNISGATRTTRYQALGNSWAVPVIRWIGERIISSDHTSLQIDSLSSKEYLTVIDDNTEFYNFGKDSVIKLKHGNMNVSVIPEDTKYSCLVDILSPDAPKEIYISPVGCNGILRRRQERHTAINPHLEEVLVSTASQMDPDEIEKRSRIQRRGKYSK